MNYYDLDPGEQRRLSARRLFRYIRDYVEPYHPYLRRAYRQSGVDLSRLESPDDIRRLPIIDKNDLQKDPTLFILRPTVAGGPPLPEGFDTAPPRKSALLKYALQTLFNHPPDYSALVRQPTFKEKARRRGLLEWQPIHFHVSTGSTGSPTPATYTHYDFTHALPELSSMMVLPKKLDPAASYYDWTDRTMSVFPGAPHVAFFGPVLAKILIGISSFETFGGSVIPTDRQITIFANGGFSNMAAIPSYLVHWLRRATILFQEGKIPPLKALKRALVGAEPLSEPLREYIRKLALGVGADPRFVIFQTMGMTELKWTALECNEGSGMHLNPKYFFAEILHPETREPVADGEPGVLVFSHIDWRGTALIRYWTGDLIKGGMTFDRCPYCGYTFPRIHPPICRAVKDFTKIKGARVDLSLLVEVVRDTPGVRQFQVVLESEESKEAFSRDLLVVHVGPERGSSREEIEQRLRERVKEYSEVTPDRIVFEDDEALEKRLFAKNGIKAEYLVERRAEHI